MTNIKIIDAGDKAISAGEESEISISNMLISNSKMGLVSKDNSKLFAQNVNIYESDIAISAYLKKSEYGPAFIEAKKITIENSKLKYLKQKNSVISIDENLIPDFNCNQNKEACLTISQ